MHDAKKKKKYTEAAYVNNLWAPLVETFFRDSRFSLKWGDSVSNESSTSRKDAEPNESSNVIGGKIILRIISQSGHDVLNFEFACHSGNLKYGKDRRKILREAKK